MVGVSASVFPLHHKVQKLSSGTGSPGWPRKNGRKMVVVVVWLLTYRESSVWHELVSRRDTTLLAQLRSVHSVYLKACKHLMDTSIDPNCPKCALEHWPVCPGTPQARMDIFSMTRPLPLSTLSNVFGQIGHTGKMYTVMASANAITSTAAAAAAAVILTSHYITF